jgi:hypothetical protein
MLFMTSVDDLRQSSRQMDITGVGNAYGNLVASCVHCHAFVRDTRNARLLPRSDGTTAVRPTPTR